MAGMLNLLAIQFGQAIDVVVVGRSDAEILRQIDDTNILRHGMLGQELSTLAMPHAQEEDVDRLQRQTVGELHVRLAEQPLVDVGQQVLGVGRTVDKAYLHIRVMQQQADEFARSIACATDNTSFHNLQFILGA